MFQPTISIIIVVFNAVQTLEETLKSIIEQSYKNRFIIIKDGGSTDGTLDIIKKYQTEIYKWTSESDAGIYDAMNTAVQISSLKSDYVYFIGSDDKFYSATALEEFVAMIGLIYSVNSIFYGNVIYKKANKIYDGEFTDFKFCLRNICHQAILYPTAIFEVYEFDLSYKYLADFVFNLSIKADKVYKFVYLDSTLAIYNDEGTSGQNVDQKFLANRLTLIRKAFSKWIYTYAYVRFAIKRLFK